MEHDRDRVDFPAISSATRKSITPGVSVRGARACRAARFWRSRSTRTGQRSGYTDRETKKFIKYEEETQAALEKQAAIEEEWTRWWRGDKDVARQLSEIYNDKFNYWVTPEWDGSHLDTRTAFPGFTTGRAVRMSSYAKYQLNAIWRMVASKGNMLLAHVVRFRQNPHDGRERAKR